MAEFTKEDFDRVKAEDYVEDEFGLGMKGYLLARAVFYAVGTFAILGAVFALLFGATTLNDLVSNATALNSSSQLITDTGLFNGLKICMFAQAVYTVGSLVCAAMLYFKRAKIYAFIDLGIFVAFVAVFVVFGSFDILFNGSAWLLYLLINPIWSFIGLFGGKHFAYMPMI